MTKKASQLPGYQLRLLRQRLARRKAHLLDPNWLEHSQGPHTDQCALAQRKPREFPPFAPGMTTGQYISTYQTMQRERWGVPIGEYPPLTFSHRVGVPAPVLDPSQPEVIEEVLP